MKTQFFKNLKYLKVYAILLLCVNRVCYKSVSTQNCTLLKFIVRVSTLKYIVYLRINKISLSRSLFNSDVFYVYLKVRYKKQLFVRQNTRKFILYEQLIMNLRKLVGMILKIKATLSF